MGFSWLLYLKPLYSVSAPPRVAPDTQLHAYSVHSVFAKTEYCAVLELLYPWVMVKIRAEIE